MRPARWLAPVLWAGVILALTSWPNPPASGTWPPGTDKAVHAWLYAVLAFLSLRAGARERSVRMPWRIALWVAAGVVLFAAVDEWHQRFIPGRGMDPIDWLADAVGAGVGIATFGLAANRARARRESVS